MRGEYEYDEAKSEGIAQCDPDELTDSPSNVTCKTPLDMPMARKNWIDTSIEVRDSIPEVRSGVAFGQGERHACGFSTS